MGARKPEIDVTVPPLSDWGRITIVVDTREGALEEAGDLLIPISEGVIAESAIHTQLSDLLKGEGARGDADEITLFKSVGYALEDLIAARLLVEQAG